MTDVEQVFHRGTGNGEMRAGGAIPPCEDQIGRQWFKRVRGGSIPPRPSPARSSVIPPAAFAALSAEYEPRSGLASQITPPDETDDHADGAQQQRNRQRFFGRNAGKTETGDHRPLANAPAADRDRDGRQQHHRRNQDAGVHHGELRADAARQGDSRPPPSRDG